MNQRLNFEISRDFYLNVVNDGSWKTHPVIEAMKKRYSAAALLQNGTACEPLGLKAYEGCADTWIYSPHSVADRNAAHVNFGVVDHLSIGRYALASRALLRFDMKSVPKGAKVGSACVQLYMFERRRAPELEAYEVLKAWGAGRGVGDIYFRPPVMDGEASWNCHQHPSKWEEGGCGAAGKDRSEKPVGASQPFGEARGWVTIDIDPKLVQRWIDDAGSNLGLLVKHKTEADGTECKYRSADFDDVGMRPRLVIGFTGGVSGSGAERSRTAARSRVGPEAEPEVKGDEPLPEGFGRIILTSGEVIVAKNIMPSAGGVSYVGQDGRRRSISIRKVRKIERPK